MSTWRRPKTTVLELRPFVSCRLKKAKRCWMHPEFSEYRVQLLAEVHFLRPQHAPGPAKALRRHPLSSERAFGRP